MGAYSFAGKLIEVGELLLYLKPLHLTISLLIIEASIFSYSCQKVLDRLTCPNRD